ncbi:MAG: EAL domain-containing protein [Pseudoxanthomonas sp.]
MPRPPDDPSRPRPRAETPPPRFWRRWTGQDAPAAAAPYPLAQAVADAPIAVEPPPAPVVAATTTTPTPIEPERALLAELAGVELSLTEPVAAGAIVTETIATEVVAPPEDTVQVASVVLDLPAQSTTEPEPAPGPQAGTETPSGPDADPDSEAGDADADTDASATDGDPAATAPYRVLIVEDDRAQALFAQSVLRGAGMLAEVQMQAEGTIEAIDRFRPDLVLMDLHMPGHDGMDLTQAIRRRPEYLHLPIVFLTGDPDPERQYEVLESGADDFLTKPIRPRHLIAAVSNRILRARLRAPVAAEVAAQTVNPETGLPTRAHVLERLGATIREQTIAGSCFIEIAGATGLRDRLGYARFEQLMLQAGRRLAQVAQPHLLARLSDNNFLALAEGVAPEALESLARTLRDGLRQEPFPLPGEENLHLRAVIGYAALPQAGFVDSGSALEATERAALLARRRPGEIAAYEPPPPAEDSIAAALAGATAELAFQPIVAVAGGEAAQYQALLRLRRADGTLLPAAQVVPLAEQDGRIVELDRQVIGKALDLLARQQAEGAPLRLFVSQSPRSLARDDAADWLLQELSARGVEPSSLVIDLRLDDALIHTVTLRGFCQRLMTAGVQFCLGQYEPGSEAEALLTQLPLGYLRVSRRYAAAHAEPALRDELREVIDLAHRHGLQVIGQQVEDPQAAASMWLGGVDFIQGNLVQGVGDGLDFDFHNAVL